MSTNRVEQHSAYVFSVAILQAWPTELTFGPHTKPTATYCLGVQSLLSALVTRAALKEQHTHTVGKPHKPRKPESLVQPRQHKGWLTFSLSQILSLLRYAMLSRSSSVISSTDLMSYWLFLMLRLFLLLCTSPTHASSTCPITTDKTAS